MENFVQRTLGITLCILACVMVICILSVVGQAKMHQMEVDAIIARRYALLAPLLNETAENGVRKLVAFVLDEPIDVLDAYLEVFLRQQRALREAYLDAVAPPPSHGDDLLMGMAIAKRSYQVALDRLIRSVARLGVNCKDWDNLFDTEHRCSLYNTNPSFMANAVRAVRA